jgi:aminomuconate-semialdehyde/2-hydroxymuconate-6-semialdehyde dehydrogenase
VRCCTGSPESVGAALTEHRAVDRITFTGESATGRVIARAAAANLTPVSFELGGKGANVVFDDADLDNAVDWSIKAIFTNSGQVCLAGSRLVVHERVYEQFLDRFVAAAAQLVFGPVVTVHRFETEQEAVQQANDSRYGLNAMVFTENLSRAHRVSAALRAGTVWVNCFFIRDLRAPFGGVGLSGVGREGGTFSREFFTEPKAVVVQIQR